MATISETAPRMQQAHRVADTRISTPRDQTKTPQANPNSLRCYKKIPNEIFFSAWGAPGGTAGNEIYRFTTLIPENMNPVGTLVEIPLDC